jgi:hypothetical protein
MGLSSMRISHYCAALLFSTISCSQQWNMPLQTVPFAHQGVHLGGAPMPTAAPAWPKKFKRQEVFQDTCGFVAGNACTAFTPRFCAAIFSNLIYSTSGPYSLHKRMVRNRGCERNTCNRLLLNHLLGRWNIQADGVFPFNDLL